MVVTLHKSTTIKPREFYGSSLPRPRYFSDPRFNKERVDPPVSVMDPLLSWAKEAHWSMGGLSFKHLRLQGRLEGNAAKLRAQLDNNNLDDFSPITESTIETDNNKEKSGFESPPPAPLVVKKRKILDPICEDEEEELVVGGGVRKRIARKLDAEFDEAAKEAELEKVGSVTRSGRRFGVDYAPKKVIELDSEVKPIVHKQTQTRSSSRLANRKSRKVRE